MLGHLHILLNYEWDSRALLSLILVGLPELQDRLALRRNRALYSRIHHRLAIGSLTPDDTAEYVRMRLTRAGCDRELFPADTVALLHEATVGAMRDIDRLAAAALREAARRKRRLVERDGSRQKHFAKQELQGVLTRHGFTVRKMQRVFYPWKKEGLRKPRNAGTRMPWDWLVLAERL